MGTPDENSLLSHLDIIFLSFNIVNKNIILDP